MVSPPNYLSEMFCPSPNVVITGMECTYPLRPPSASVCFVFGALRVAVLAVETVFSIHRSAPAIRYLSGTVESEIIAPHGQVEPRMELILFVQIQHGLHHLAQSCVLLLVLGTTSSVFAIFTLVNHFCSSSLAVAFSATTTGGSGSGIQWVTRP